MSRSAFAARFTAARRRARDAPTSPGGGCRSRSTALRRRDATVGELAGRLGYRSEAAFARAFKRVIGTPPGAVRRNGDMTGVKERQRRPNMYNV